MRLAQSVPISILVALVTGLTGAFLASSILRGMGASPHTVIVGAIYTRILFGGSIVIVLLFLIIINLFCFWAFQIPLAYVLAITFGFGPSGVFVAILLTESSLTVVSWVIFRQGRCKKVKI